MSAFSRGETLALAYQRCVHCFGLGIPETRRHQKNPCKCVLRATFRACYERFERCSSSVPRMSSFGVLRMGGKNSGARASGSAACGPGVKRRYGYPDGEYCADFVAIARRALGGRDSYRYRVFEAHFLRHQGWKQCAALLSIDRGSFFHEVYRIEAALGFAFRETQPFPLWPLDEYFGGRTRRRIERGYGLRQPLSL